MSLPRLRACGAILRRGLALLALAQVPIAVAHAGTDAATAPEWVTPAETARFRTTPDYAQTRAYLERLAAAAPQTLKLTRFGVSPEGRDLMLVIAASGGEFTPAAARASGKTLLFVQAGIHAGEIEGKDAGLMLLRDLALGHTLPHALDHTILLFLPIFNVDGHENSTPYLRINQNGPAEMGFRATAQNLNLNRDYIKADAPEMRDWLALWNAWLPDALVDIHTTDGADFQYDLTWYTEDWGPLDPAVKAWQDTALRQRVFAQMPRRGHLVAPYIELKDGRDITRGLENFGSGVRFSTGFAALQNRAGLLVETHMLKPYATRVRATYDLIALILADLAAHPGDLRRAVTAADQRVIAAAAQPGATLPIVFDLAPTPVTRKLAGFAFTQTPSDLSGDTWTRYDPAKPRTFEVPDWRDLVATQTLTLPAAYLVPAGWTDAIAKLAAQGLVIERTTRPLTLRVGTTQLDDPVWGDKPFEGRLMLRSFKASTQTGDARFAPGAAVVAMDQRAAHLAANLLEPAAPDSLLRWGLFNAAFEQKEYGEERVLEQLARDLLAADPGLRAQFEAKLAADPAFARNPRARLEFFYRHSRWYTDQHVGRYPVVTLDAEALAQVRAAR